MITEKNGIKQSNWNHAKCQLDGSQNQRSQIYIIRIIKSFLSTADISIMSQVYFSLFSQRAAVS